jgi:hypothetical protein
MFYDLQFIALSNRLENATADENKGWMVHLWDVKG